MTGDALRNWQRQFGSLPGVFALHPFTNDNLLPNRQMPDPQQTNQFPATGLGTPERTTFVDSPGNGRGEFRYLRDPATVERLEEAQHRIQELADEYVLRRFREFRNQLAQMMPLNTNPTPPDPTTLNPQEETLRPENRAVQDEFGVWRLPLPQPQRERNQNPQDEYPTVMNFHDHNPQGDTLYQIMLDAQEEHRQRRTEAYRRAGLPQPPHPDPNTCDVCKRTRNFLYRDTVTEGGVEVAARKVCPDCRQDQANV